MFTEKLQKTQVSVKKKIELPVNKVMNTFILYNIFYIQFICTDLQLDITFLF